LIKINKHAPLLLIAFVLEWCLLVLFRNETGYLLSPLLLIAISVFYFSFGLKNYFLFEENKKASLKTGNLKIVWFLYFSCVIITSIIAQRIFSEIPLDISRSDIIPLIQKVYVERFLNSQYVYAAYTGFNYGTFTPNYLPFHWLPFCISTLLNFDPRFIPLAVFFIVIAIYFLQQCKRNQSNISLYFKLILPFVLFISILIKQKNDFANTVEMLIVSYYLIVCLGFFAKNIYLSSVGYTTTILSRYSLIFWLPVEFLNRFIDNRKKLLFLSFLVFCGILVFYIFPFFLHQPDSFFNGSNLWQKAALGEWKGQAWQKPGDNPFQLFQGVGFASWFYKFFPGTLEEKIEVCKNTMLVFVLLTSILLMVLRFKKYSSICPNLFSLLSLKLSLSIFFSFLFVPYVYLFWTSLFISVVIISRIDFDGEDSLKIKNNNQK